MANMCVKGSRFCDVDRESKIRMDVSLNHRQTFGSLTSKGNQAAFGMIYNIEKDSYWSERGFARTTKGGEINGSTGLGRSGQQWRRSSTPGDDRRRIVTEANRRWIRSYIPVFSSTSNRKELLDWVDRVDRLFEEIQAPADLKCELAYSAFEGEAEQWWRQLQHQRFLECEPEIRLWPWMKFLLLNNFRPVMSSTKCATGIDSGVQGEGSAFSLSDDLFHTIKFNQTEPTEVHVKQRTVDKPTPTRCSTEFPFELISRKHDGTTKLGISGASEVLHECDEQSTKMSEVMPTKRVMEFTKLSINETTKDEDQIEKAVDTTIVTHLKFKPACSITSIHHNADNSQPKQRTLLPGSTVHNFEFDHLKGADLTRSGAVNVARQGLAVTLSKYVQAIDFLTGEVLVFSFDPGGCWKFEKLNDQNHVKQCVSQFRTRLENQLRGSDHGIFVTWMNAKLNTAKWNQQQHSWATCGGFVSSIDTSAKWILDDWICSLNCTQIAVLGNEHHCDKSGFTNYILPCASKLCSDGLVHSTRNESMLRVLKTFSDGKDKENDDWSYNTRMEVKLAWENISRSCVWLAIIDPWDDYDGGTEKETYGKNLLLKMNVVTLHFDKKWMASMLIGKLVHGKYEYASSTYFMLKFVSFLFDPGGVLCPMGMWRTCLRIIRMMTVTIIFGIFLVDLRSCDWSFDMVCGETSCIIIFSLRHDVIVWADHSVSTLKQIKSGMGILSSKPQVSVLFYVTILMWKYHLMRFEGYKGIWKVYVLRLQAGVCIAEQEVCHPNVLLENEREIIRANGVFVGVTDASCYVIAMMNTIKWIVSRHHPRFVGIYWDIVDTFSCVEIANLLACLCVGPIFSYYGSGGYDLIKDLLRVLVRRSKHQQTSYENYQRIYVPATCPLICKPEETLRVNTLPSLIQKMLFLVEIVVNAEIGDPPINVLKVKLVPGYGYEFQMPHASTTWSAGATLGCVQEVAALMRCGQKTIIFLIEKDSGCTVKIDEEFLIVTWF